MLKHLFVGAVLVSSVALAGPGSYSAAPLSPAPPPGSAVRHGPAPGMGPSSRVDDRLDARRASQLLEQFEMAAAQRDRRAMRRVDAQFQAFVDQELAEARRELARGQRGFSHGRSGRRASAFDARRDVYELENLQRQLDRVAGRVDRRSVYEKRTLYAQARTLAERELAENGHRRG